MGNILLIKESSMDMNVVGCYQCTKTGFLMGANIGHINKSKQSYMFSRYKQFIEEEYNDSIETSLMEEIGMYEDLTCIDIMSDDRHGWHKNAKDTSVVAIGENLWYSHIRRILCWLVTHLMYKVSITP
jgi:hypothetical protein